MSSSDPAATLRVVQMLTAYWRAQAIYVAAKLRVSDHLRDGPLPADELALRCDSDPSTLTRLMRALAGEGFFHEDLEGRFSLGPLGGCLDSGNPASAYATAIMLGEEHFAAWGQLLESVRDGQPAFQKVYHQEVFAYYREHTESGDVFHRAMGELSRSTHRAAVAAYDFAGFQHVVDVGGGRGELLSAILATQEHLRGTLYEQAAVIPQAEALFHQRGLDSRVSTVAGDFFQSVPPGGDCYVLSTVIHDWTDEDSIRILRNVRKAVRGKATLLLLERVLKEPNQPDFGRFSDLNMLVMTGGRERTQDQFATLYQEAGFQLTRVIRTASTSCIIEGRPR
jgi:hypothetical protein